MTHTSQSIVGLFVAFLILTVLLTSSCNKERVCFIPTNVTAKVLFSIKESRDTFIDTDTSLIDTTIVTFRDSLMTAPAMQTFAYDTNFVIIGQRGDRIVQFSLDPDTHVIQYLIIPDYNTPEWHDTLTVHYTSHLFFISNDCGFTYNYQIQSASVTSNILDSSYVMHQDVTTEGSRQHIRVFFFK